MKLKNKKEEKNWENDVGRGEEKRQGNEEVKMRRKEAKEDESEGYNKTI
jgi:hypothetical protein